MKDKFFLDTNILVYSFDHTSADKREKAIEIISHGLSAGNTIISYQVVQEFVHVSMNKFEVRLSREDCLNFCDTVLFPLWTVYSSQLLVKKAIDISQRWKHSFYDSLILASAIEANCTVLYSEDFQHRQKIYSLEVFNPFVDL